MTRTPEGPEAVGSESWLGALPNTQQRSAGDFPPLCKVVIRTTVKVLESC